MKNNKSTNAYVGCYRVPDTLRVFLRELKRLGGTTDKKIWQETVGCTFFKTPANALENARALALAGSKRVLLRKKHSRETVTIDIKWGQSRLY